MPSQAFAGWVRPNPQLQNVSLITVADSPYSVAPLDVFIGVDTSGGAITVNLPPASSSAGRVIEVYDISGFANTTSFVVQPSGGDLISGAASQTISEAYSGITIISDGTNWEITAQASSNAASTGLVLISTALPSAATATSFSGLDGDADKVYIIEGNLRIATPGAAVPLELRVNNDAVAGDYANGITALVWNTAGIAPALSNPVGPWQIFGGTINADDTVSFSLRIDAARTDGSGSTIRTITGDTTVYDTSGRVYRASVSGAYSSTAANLTSLNFTNGGVGTTYSGRISLYKLVT